jgi:protoporphyrinogen oxidase
MRYIVIGAGVAGLAIAQLLNKDNEVIVLEKDDRPGGMIKCDRVEGSLFHRTGGHVFNTKREDVMKWFWSFFDQEKDFIKAVRNSSVVMDDGKLIPYPIEYHAYLLGKETGAKIVADLVEMARHQDSEPSNFEDFLKGRFGRTLYELYFKPFNWKVWRRDLTKVPLSWLEGKLPMPTVEEIIFANIYHVEESQFVHSSFYYPKEGGSQFLADTFAKGLDIMYNTAVTSVQKTETGWKVNGQEADRIVFCGNIKQLPHLVGHAIDISSFANAIDALAYHGTTAVFCEIDQNPYSWLYQPSMNHLSHRIICTGNFSATNNANGKMTGTIEFTDEISQADILEQLKKIPFHPSYLTHHYEKYTYPIQYSGTRTMISSLKQTLEPEGFYLCGRFAEWEYANRDVCMGYAMDLYHQKLNRS